MVNGKILVKKFYTCNPLNHTRVSSYIESNDVAINKALESADHSFNNW